MSVDPAGMPATARATQRAFYDADVLVVGAGPAGLSAALRVRWVKGYRALPSSVVVFDPGPPGGLLRWGGCVLTGPSWASSGEELNARLLQDVAQLHVPIVREQVVSLDREGPYFAVTLEHGARWTGRAVVLATGFRAIGPEGEAYPTGVRVTFKGYEFFPSLVRAAARDAGGRGLLVIGTARTAAMAELLASHAGEAGGLRFLLEDEPGSSDRRELHEALAALGTIESGRLERIERGPDNRIAAVEIRTTSRQEPDARSSSRRDDRDLLERRGAPAGRVSTRAPAVTGPAGHATSDLTRIPCGAILLDYNAFELCPALDIRGLIPARDDRGFVRVDAEMRTGIDGVFAAGDITGRYAATLVALGDGVTAGFSAYRHAFAGKLGREPRLFAYRATDGDVAVDPHDLPALPDGAVPVRLGDPNAMAGYGPIAAALDDQTDLAALRARFGRAATNEALDRLIDRKEITVHCPDPASS